MRRPHRSAGAPTCGRWMQAGRSCPRWPILVFLGRICQVRRMPASWKLDRIPRIGASGLSVSPAKIEPIASSALEREGMPAIENPALFPAGHTGKVMILVPDHLAGCDWVQREHGRTARDGAVRPEGLINPGRAARASFRPSIPGSPFWDRWGLVAEAAPPPSWSIPLAGWPPAEAPPEAFPISRGLLV